MSANLPFAVNAMLNNLSMSNVNALNTTTNNSNNNNNNNDNKTYQFHVSVIVTFVESLQIADSANKPDILSL